MPLLYVLRPVWVLSGLLLLGACSGSRQGAAEADPAAASASAPAPTMGVTDFLAAALRGAPDLSYGALVERLGPPVRVKVAAAPGAGQTDTLRTAIYYGLEVDLHEATAPPASRLARLALTDARYVAPNGLRVGYAYEHVLRLLGRPTKQTATELFYEQTDPRPHVLVLFLEHRAVSLIEWRIP